MKAYAAQIDITPDFEVELCGFASRTQPAIGVLEPIYARALYLEDDAGEKLLWIACDLIAFDRALVEDFRAWAKHQLDLERRQVLLSATHTHSAPATVHLSAAGAYSQAYVSNLSMQLRLLAKHAVFDLQPCAFRCASAPLNLAIDRRNQPSSHVDPMAWAIAFTRKDGSNVAAAVNYAMHPVALGHVERRVSPDWCGGASAAMSKQLAGAPITLVSNGAAGNINPPAVDQSPETVRGYGEAIAAAAIGALRSAEPQADAKLKSKSITVDVPLDWHDERGIDRIADKFIAGIKPGWVWEKPFREAVTTWRNSLKPIVAAGGGRIVPIELQAIRIGDVTIVAVNGEMFTRFTALLRQQLGNNVFTVAYANSAFGYIPTRAAYAEGGYEVETAHFFYNSFRPRPGGLELLAERAVELVKSL